MRLKTKLDINLGYFESNVQSLKEIAPKKEIIFMVKANAYGHGITQMTNFAHFELGLQEFGVASLGEALKLREDLGNALVEILVFSDTSLTESWAREAYVNQKITPILSSLDDLRIFLNDHELSRLPLYIHFNTGMNRLGISMTELSTCIEILKNGGRKSVHHIMTHLACASLSMDTNSHNIRQKENFRMIKDELNASDIGFEESSLANSGALEQREGLDNSHIRPGLMLYGPSSLIPKLRSKSAWKVKLISSLKAEVLQIFQVDRGRPIGYGATPCPDSGHVVVIGIGYGDGFSTLYQGLKILVNGQHGIIHGRVNMDMAQVFFKESPRLHKGDVIDLWDHSDESFLNFSDNSNRISYEVFTSLTERLPRVYHN